MSKYVIDENTLTGIGDAVRAKSGTSEKILVSELATAITNIPTGGGGGGDIEVEPIVLSGSQNYGCAGTLSSNYVKLYGDTISTNALSNTNYMFYKYKLESIPFSINLHKSCNSIAYMFGNCEQLKTVPVINGVDKDIPTAEYNNTIDISRVFSYCSNLKYIPDDIFMQIIPNKEYWDKRKELHTSASAGIFEYCRSLRKLPDISMIVNKAAQYNSIYNSITTGCIALDEIIDLPVTIATFTSNAFSNVTDMCYRLKDFTFETNEDGTAKIASWKNQTLNLSGYTGYFSTMNIDDVTIKYNSGITKDKQVKDDATYAALKDDPDWFTCDINYSRYNHDSAVRTINSLPDCSAYGTNTIKFKSAGGSKTDGGAVGNLTSEEIAVASAKGWSVAFV